MAKKSTSKNTRSAARRSLQDVVSSRLIACVPTTWLDDLLTGPRAVLSGKGGTWGCPDIARLLNAIRERMTKAANQARVPLQAARSRSNSHPYHTNPADG